MSGDRITLDFAALRAHSSTMRGFSAQVQEAVSAVQSIDLGGGAFGIMCSFLVPPASLVSNATAQAISAEKGMLDRTADEVTAWAGDAQQLEQQLSEQIQTITKALD